MIHNPYIIQSTFKYYMIVLGGAGLVPKFWEHIWILPLILYFVISSFHFVHNIQSTKLIAVSSQCLQICYPCFSMEMPIHLWRYYKNICCTNDNTSVLKKHVAVHKESHDHKFHHQPTRWDVHFFIPHYHPVWYWFSLDFFASRDQYQDLSWN